MTTEEVDALVAYIDAKIDEEFASREVGEDGHTSSAHSERKVREFALAALRTAAEKAKL